MISSRKLGQMARRWMKAANIVKKRITSQMAPRAAASSPPLPQKGQLAVYSSDGQRFLVSLAWLRTDVLLELLHQAEEEFGLPTNGPITLPCEAAFMEQLLAALQMGTRTGRSSWRQCSSPGWEQNGMQPLACAV